MGSIFAGALSAAAALTSQVTVNIAHSEAPFETQAGYCALHWLAEMLTSE